MLAVEDVRRLALDLPDVTEQDHHGRPSFRVRNKIFATLWTPEALNVMPGEELILAAVERAPGACSKVLWGGRLRAVLVDLRVADPEQVEDLLFAAWSRRAPRRPTAG
ncbi:MAG: MmcQ/YjbR family DNA-binding protein [Actinomycetota bacterium]|nr:MmcQ/YjbR family DNA-binding protein [Actinomycetota bacterium]